MTLVDLSVVVPIHNEEKNIELLYKELKQVLEELNKSYEVLFIDDGSTDNSLQKLKELHKREEAVEVISFYDNFGQSAALQAGFDEAKGETIIALDGDMQNDPKDIPKLLSELDGHDCVSGWRKERNDPLGKKISSKVASWMRRKLLDSEIHDFGCTLKAYKKEAIDSLELQGEMHRYIPPLLRWKGYDVTEVEVNHRERQHGKTHYSWQRLPKGFMDLFNVWFWQQFSGRPLHIFGGLGILSIAIGVIGGIYAFYLKFMGMYTLTGTPLPLFAALMCMIGVMLFVSGILADIGIKAYHSAQGTEEYNIEEKLE